MDQLDRHRPQQVLVGAEPSPAGGRGQGQDRAEPLSAGGQEMGGDLVEEPVARSRRTREQGLEALESVFECGKPRSSDDVHFYRTIGQDRLCQLMERRGPVVGCEPIRSRPGV